ncbi:MAG: 50S ribosomal protein L15 [Myxococcota bacterium]|jgi:large subunit ribosomal protein L15|nr:50S ribosomal protein L15 [Deltaproteobacteria bacterium]MCP4244524.1 50S ribosomal protein L15 [bacterium]MDP6075868.1 50S ribosomal protein L15 [Myxococcota bacterium]MBT39427.1 50S ribosomal protein L15 [Deltaproteobacteria bacterium]MDP6243901.1 50S ribosomal protein L15 [Myxococcota bacterium]
MLDRLAPRPGAQRPHKRVGRGPGSGLNKTAGRGEKGQGKRSPGREVPFHFEGGQMPMARRLPKRGFHNLFRKTYQIVNVGVLAVFGDGASIDREVLVARGLVNAKRGGVKLLGEGEAPKNLKVKVHQVSAGARKKIEEAGGSIEVVK